MRKTADCCPYLLKMQERIMMKTAIWSLLLSLDIRKDKRRNKLSHCEDSEVNE